MADPHDRGRAHLSRREFVRRGLGAAALGPLLLRDPTPVSMNMNTRPIPSTGEPLPIVGLGTWQTFDVTTSEAALRPLREVLGRFAGAGGRLVDSSPMYGRSEAVVGQLVEELELRNSLFFATKVWTRGAADGVRQMERSMERMRARPMDLMQVHNLLDVEQHLAILREWKDAGRIRYVGITHYQVEAYERLEALIRAHELDFVQFNYSIATRDSERGLLQVAAEHGTAVIINRPFEGGGLFRSVRGRPLPDSASEIDCESWAQFFLKYILGAPEVTCVIPATSDPDHATDNTRAGHGRLPTPEQRQRMLADWLAR